jgi:hypothetical protein
MGGADSLHANDVAPMAVDGECETLLVEGPPVAARRSRN